MTYEEWKKMLVHNLIFKPCFPMLCITLRSFNFCNFSEFNVLKAQALVQTHLERKVSLIEKCPHFRGQNVHNTNIQDNTSCPN